MVELMTYAQAELQLKVLAFGKRLDPTNEKE